MATKTSVLPKTLALPRVGVRRPNVGARRSLRVAARESRKGVPYGFVEEDNSGKSNIFGIMPSQLYTSSPTVDKVAKKGLGGTQGVAVLLVLGATVAAGLSAVLFQQGGQETLDSVAASYDVDSLGALAQRLSESA